MFTLKWILNICCIAHFWFWFKVFSIYSSQRKGAWWPLKQDMKWCFLTQTTASVFILYWWLLYMYINSVTDTHRWLIWWVCGLKANNWYSCSVPGREKLALSYQESLVNALGSGCSYLVCCCVIRRNYRVGFCLKSSRPVGVFLTCHRLLQICDKASCRYW